MNRRKSREILMRVMYEKSINNEPIEELINNFNEANLEKLDELDIQFVMKEAKGILEHIEQIDQNIERNMKKWKLDRLPKIDLSIMRIATFEIIYEEGIPENVSINEAVELSKNYSTDNSPSFINGVLDSLKNNYVK